MCFQIIQSNQSLAVYMVFYIERKVQICKSEEWGTTQLVLLSYPLAWEICVKTATKWKMNRCTVQLNMIIVIGELCKSVILYHV
jgi:hypothetical protein